MKKNQFISIVLTAFILVGCGSSTGNTYIAPQQISDPQIAEITPTFETQIERINNCDSANPIYNVSYKTIETQKASFEVSVGAGGLVTGTPVPSVLEVQLEAKITAALAKDYGLTTEKNHDITLENPQGSYLEHTIEWKVTRVKGLIDVIYGDGVAQVAFDKIANVELYNRTSKSLGCDGSGASIPPTSTVSSNTVPATQAIANANSSVYDDFNNSEFDGKFNSALWSISGYAGNGQIYQQDGKLLISDIADTSGDGFTLGLKNWKESKFSSFQVRVMLSNEHEGSEGNVTLNAGGGTYDIPGSWGEFGIGHQVGNLPEIHAQFGNGQGYKKTNVQYDTWFTLRVVFDPSTNKFDYFIDDNLLTSITISTQNTDVKFQPAIQLWHKRGTSVKAYIDDVIIKLEK